MVELRKRTRASGRSQEPRIPPKKTKWIDEKIAKLTSFFPCRKRSFLEAETQVCEKQMKLIKPIEKPVFTATLGRSRVLRSRRTSPFEGLSSNVFSALSEPAFAEFIRLVPMRQLSQYALTGPCLTKRLLQYASTAAFRIRFAESVKEYEVNGKDPKDCELIEDPFSTFGSFLKVVTFAEPTSSRLRLVIPFFRKTCKSGVNDYLGWGRLIMALTDKWDFKECEKLVSEIFNEDGPTPLKELSSVIEGEFRLIPEKELEWRNFLRSLFLEQLHGDKAERSFWLSALVSLFGVDMQKKAKLLMLLYGPKKEEDGQMVMDWDGLCNVAVSSYEQSSLRVGEVAEGIVRLLDTREINIKEYQWSLSDVFNLMEEVTTYPEPWCLDNFTALMVHQPRLVSVAVFARMTHGFEEEAGSIAANVKSLSFRWMLDVPHLMLSPLRDVFSWLNPARRIQFYRSFVTANSALLMELVSNGASHVDVTMEVNAQVAVAPILAALAALL